jgi:glucose/arabinose dehydrogenase
MTTSQGSDRVRDVAEVPDGSLLLLTDGDDGELLHLTLSREKEAG